MRYAPRTLKASALATAFLASTWLAVAPQPVPAMSNPPVVPRSGTVKVIALPQPAASLFRGSSRSQPFNRPLLTRDPVALNQAKKVASDRAAAARPGTSHAPLALAAPKTSIYGGNNMAGLGAGCCTPSDSTGDMGPRNFVEMVNTEVAVYPPACGPCGPTGTAPLEVFAGFAGGCTADPQIEWDPQGGRWLYSVIVLVPTTPGRCAGPFTYEALAFGWSRTSDPTDLAGGWCRFAINNGTNLADYDKLGHDDNFISIGANAYSNFGIPPSTFLGAIVYAISKPAAGDTSCTGPSSANVFGLTNTDKTSAFTPVPADTKDSSPYGYIVAAHDVAGGTPSSTQLTMWHLSSSSGTPVLTADGDFQVAPYMTPPNVPQPIAGSQPCSTSGKCLDSLDGRLTQAVAHFDPDAGNEAVWTQHAVTDSTGPLSVERWYELIPSLGSVRQSGDISDPSFYVFNGAVSPSMAGNEAVIFYNEGGPSGYVTYWAQSRNTRTPLGTFTNPVIIASSSSTDNDISCGANQKPSPTVDPCRWGDYSAARPDPNSTNAVWGVGMLNNASMSLAPSWFTQIAAITPGCATATIGGGQSYRNNYSFTGSSAGCANTQYEFWLRYPNGTWTLRQSFSPGATWTWDSTGAPLGTYLVHVWANQIGDSTASWDAFGEIAFTLTQPAPCATAGIGPLSASQPAGSTVGFVATSSGCQAPVYEYWFQGLSGTWNLGRSFGADPSWSWNTAGFAPGTYNIHVWANQQGDSTSSFESYAAATATLTGCTTASVSPPSTSQPAGSAVALTAGSSGCPNPQYEFWVGYPDGTWHMTQSWGGATFNWNTTGLAPGTYSVHVWANQQGASTATWEANGASTVTLTSGACTSAALAPVNPSAPAGTMVVLTASSGGCANPQYEFWAQYPNGTWYLIQGWGGATFNWNTAGLGLGTYNVHVWANNIGDSTATWEAYGADIVTLTGCASAAVSVSPSSPQPVGTPITFTATSTGCPNPVYEFWLEYPDGTWHLMRGFSATATWSWTTTGFPKGNYVLHVWANQQGTGTSTFQTYGTATYTLT